MARIATKKRNEQKANIILDALLGRQLDDILLRLKSVIHIDAFIGKRLICIRILIFKKANIQQYVNY